MHNKGTQLHSVHFSHIPFCSLHLNSVLFTSVKFISILFTSFHFTPVEFICSGQPEEKPQYFFWPGEIAPTVHCAHISFFPIIIIFVTVFTVDKVMASTKCLHQQLQTSLLVVLVTILLQPLHNCRCGVQHHLGKSPCDKRKYLR